MKAARAKYWLAGLSCACAMTPPAFAQTQDAQRLVDRQAQYWGTACITCHGASARAAQEGGMPVLAGQDEDWLVRQLQDFAQGKRPATLMHQLSKGYSEDQIRRIARWLSAQTPGESP
jgi:cytochrome c553